MDFLTRLDNNVIVGQYVDCLDVNIKPEYLKEDKWSILPKLLLGAITREWDQRDGESTVDRTLDNTTDIKPQFKDEEPEEEVDPADA